MPNITLQYLFDLIRRHNHDGIETLKINNGHDIVDVSFETGEQAIINIYTPFTIRIANIRGRTIKAMAATDNGTVVVKNAAGSTMATLTFSASTAINTDVTAQMPTSNNNIAAGSFYTLTVAKTTAGGKAKVTIEFERIQNA